MLAKLRTLTTKQIAAVIAAVTIFGAAGAVGVTSAAPPDKPTKEQCAAAGFKNYGQCVKEWAHSHGYAGHSEVKVIETVHIEHHEEHIFQRIMDWSFHFF